MKYYQYYVEGETEKKIINTLKTEFQYIEPEKVEVFNVTQEQFSKIRTMRLKQGTTVVLVFDTDTSHADYLKSNIKFLNAQPNIGKVICISQVQNLEDELKRSCNIYQIRELTKSKSNKNFKNDLIHQSNLKKCLESASFDFNKFWVQDPTQKEFSFIKNQSNNIKINKRLY